jgi:chromate transporter
MSSPTAPEPPKPDSPRKTVVLRELALLFLRLGATSFGGPAAHVAQMEDECVRRRGWLTHEKFLDLLGAANLIPGPTSTEMALHLGFVRAGWIGLLVAGICFTLPATLMVMALAWVYVHYGSVLIDSGLLDGMKPVAISIIAVALWKLGRKAIRDLIAAGIVVVAFALDLVGGHELLILFGAGVVAACVRAIWRNPSGIKGLLSAAPLLVGETAAGGAAATTAAVGLWPMFLVFLKVGAVLFGGGYVLFAFLRADLVERRHWLTDQQLLDAIAVGQLTPGPVSTAATFIGYIVLDENQQPLGVVGALVATVAIFLPAFLLVGLSGPIVPRLRRSKMAGDFLDGVNAASLALMAAVTWRLGRGVLANPDVEWWVNGTAWLLALGSLVLLIRYRINSAWLMLGGAVMGYVLVWIRG